MNIDIAILYVESIFQFGKLHIIKIAVFKSNFLNIKERLKIFKLAFFKEKYILPFMLDGINFPALFMLAVILAVELKMPFMFFVVRLVCPKLSKA
jgi:hypothetical protein